MKKCLTWDPKLRMTPEEALIHPWIIEGLPSSIRYNFYDMIIENNIFNK